MLVVSTKDKLGLREGILIVDVILAADVEVIAEVVVEDVLCTIILVVVTGKKKKTTKKSIQKINPPIIFTISTHEVKL